MQFKRAGGSYVANKYLPLVCYSVFLEQELLFEQEQLILPRHQQLHGQYLQFDEHLPEPLCST